MAKYEQYANNAVTTLASTITAGATSLTVADASRFPSDGNFRILVEGELMLVTARSGTTFTVTRGIETTTAAAHDGGVPVSFLVTKESFLRLAADHVPLFGLETTPGPLNSLTNTSGAAVTSSSFSWTNQGSATVTDYTGAMILEPPTGTGSNLRILSKSAPSTPYRIYGAFNINLSMGSGLSHGGFCWRESATGKVKVHGLCSDPGTIPDTPTQLNIGNYTNPTTFSAWNTELPWAWSPYLTWLYIDDNGTNISVGISTNGITFMEVLSEARGTHFTTAPDEVGFYMNVNDANNNMSLAVCHWSEQ